MPEAKDKNYNRDIIDMISYENGYAAGYAEAQKAAYEIGYNDGRRDEKHQVLDKTAHRKTILKQRASGAAILALTIITSIVIMDATFALVGVPLGLALIFTKREWIA